MMTCKRLMIPALLFLASSCQLKNSSQSEQKDETLKDTSPVLSGYSMRPSDDFAGPYRGYMVTSRERYPVVFEVLDTADPHVYQGIFSVRFGNAEWVSRYFPRIEKAPTTLQLEDDFFVFENLTTTPTSIAGQLSTKDEQEKAQLFLSRDPNFSETSFASFITEMPLGRPVGGSYQGQCGDTAAVLQIETLPWGTKSASSDGWYARMQVRGRLGKPDPMMCSGDRFCIQRNFEQARYSPLDGKLALIARGSTLACDKKGGTLTCGECRFEQKDSMGLFASDQFLQVSENQMAIDTSAREFLPQTVQDAKGQYFGYLHHEARGVYQLMAIHFDMDMEDGQLGGDVAVTSYLGEGDSSEFSVFRVDDVIVPTSGHVLLSADADPVLRIARWGEGMVKGYWYSKQHGRIGSFHLMRDAVPKLAPGLVLEQPLSGTYRADGPSFALMVNAELAEDQSSVFPLRAFGNVVDAGDGHRRRRIEDFRYDVYSGVLAMILDDGRMTLGSRQAEGLSMIWPAAPRFGNEVQKEEPLLFAHSTDQNTHAPRAETSLPEIQGVDIIE